MPRYLTRRYDEGQILEPANFAPGYIRGLHMKVAIEGGRILLEALPD